MPTLNKYAQSNEKTGHYVRANVGGSHPVTLQTTNIAENVLRDNGYSAGSTVPTKLVWSMYDIDLLQTESTISNSTPAHSFSSLSQSITDSRLTESTRDQLIQYFESYSGPHQGAINKLLTDIRHTVSTDTIQEFDRENPVEMAKSLLNRFTEDSENDMDEILTERKDLTVNSILIFSQRASQIEKIGIHEHNIILYHISPISVPGKARIYDHTVSDESEYDYRIEYQDGAIISLYIREGRIINSNGSQDLLTPLEARQLTEETTPVKVDHTDVKFTMESPNRSKIAIPEKSFLEGDKELFVGVVDRISNNNNPLVELTNGHLLLDAGKEDQVYLINRVEPKWGRVLCELNST